MGSGVKNRSSAALLGVHPNRGPAPRLPWTRAPRLASRPHPLRLRARLGRGWWARAAGGGVGTEDAAVSFKRDGLWVHVVCSLGDPPTHDGRAEGASRGHHKAQDNMGSRGKAGRGAVRGPEAGKGQGLLLALQGEGDQVDARTTTTCAKFSRSFPSFFFPPASSSLLLNSPTTGLPCLALARGAAPLRGFVCGVVDGLGALHRQTANCSHFFGEPNPFCLLPPSFVPAATA